MEKNSLNKVGDLFAGQLILGDYSSIPDIEDKSKKNFNFYSNRVSPAAYTSTDWLTDESTYDDTVPDDGRIKKARSGDLHTLLNPMPGAQPDDPTNKGDRKVLDSLNYIKDK